MYHWIKKYIPDTARQRRLLEAQKKVVQVASSPAVAAGDLGRVARDICKTCADWLVVERASVWLLNEQETKLELVCLYTQEDGILEGGASLKKDQYPAYFEALLTGRAIDAHDAKKDPRTQEFSVGYLDIYHIESMLDAAIRNGDEVIGVVCCEKTHKRRLWNIDDINFCAEMADQFSHTIANQKARAAHEAMLRFEAVSQSKSQFLATISHEIRTPLNAIIGMTDQLTDTPLDQEQKEITRIIKRSGELLLSIVNDVLDLSKIESGKIDITVSEVDINFLVSECLGIFKRQAEEKNIEILFSPHPSLKMIMIDGAHLTQVLSNLMSNAIKFTQEGFIQVRILSADNRLQIRIIDTGCGISEDLKSRLFLPFEQERSSLSNGIKGTGLGLAISKRYIEAMDGQLQAESRVGEGSHFCIDLPLVEVELPGVVKKIDCIEIPRDPVNKLRIWIAEDNEVNQLVIKGILQKMGCEIVIYENGSSLISALHASTMMPDLILMDCSMPIMDGFEATLMIRSDPRTSHLPVVALTAHAFSDYAIKIKEAGMDACLTKPVKLQDIKDCLQKFFPFSVFQIS